MEGYYNIHRGNDVYIIASGKSADYVEPSFFDNKITIGINQVYNRFQTTYLVRKEPEYLMESLDKTINNTVIFISKGRCGDNNVINQEYVMKLPLKHKKRIVIFDHDPNCLTNLASLPEGNKLITSYSTITSGIHLAAYMGARNIILLGHDCGTLDDECNFIGYHTDKSYKLVHKNGQNDYKIWLTKIEDQTLKLKHLLKEKYGCSLHSINPFINFGLEGHKYQAKQSQNQIQQLMQRNGFVKISYPFSTNYNDMVSKVVTQFPPGRKLDSNPDSGIEIYRIVGLINPGSIQLSGKCIQLNNVNTEFIVYNATIDVVISEDMKLAIDVYI